MISGTSAGTSAGEGKRRIRLGMVGGGPGAFIGAVHRIAARMDDHYELVAAALSSDATRSRSAAQDLHIAPDRAYDSYTEMWPKLFSKRAFTLFATSL